MFYLAAAFIGVWLIVTLYVVFIGRRQRYLEEEMQTLEELVAERKNWRAGSSA
ncbi:MAG: CcmD family protein [Chloroflexota bacterium]|nr:CcmD family protein [Chloroflexota bacterium]